MTAGQASPPDPRSPPGSAAHPHPDVDRPGLDRPWVTLHNLASLDGRLDGFAADIGLYYDLAASLPHEAVLTGSGTILAAAAEQGVDLADEDPPPWPRLLDRDDALAWLAIVDSRGQVTRLDWLRSQPYWRDVLMVCAEASPPHQLARLRQHQVEHIVAGRNRVDLAEALRVMAKRYHVRAVRVDAGGGLNAALLAAGLVDEISVVLAPLLVGVGGQRPRHLVEDLCADAHRLELRAVERLRDGHVWLRYAVSVGDAPQPAKGDGLSQSSS